MLINDIKRSSAFRAREIVAAVIRIGRHKPDADMDLDYRSRQFVSAMGDERFIEAASPQIGGPEQVSFLTRDPFRQKPAKPASEAAQISRPRHTVHGGNSQGG